MASATTETTTRTPYRVRLHHVEACNCPKGCNCQFGGVPEYGHCEFIIGYKMIDGRYGDVDLGDVKAVVLCKYPGAIHEGNGRCVLFVDGSARPEQVEALETIFSGRAGGMPWEALSGTLKSLEGPVLKPIEMNVDGRRSSFRIPGVLEMGLTPLTEAATGDEKDVHIVYPQGGFFWDDGHISTTERMRADYGGIRFEHPGHYACYATAEWTNQPKS